MTLYDMLRLKANWQIENQESLGPFLVQLVIHFINSVLYFHAIKIFLVKNAHSSVGISSSTF